MERRETHHVKVSITEHADNTREGAAPVQTITGHAAVFYDGTPRTEYPLWDNAVERIMPNAFDRAIREGDDARALFNHDATLVLGRVSADTLKLAADDVGLVFNITAAETTVARDVVEHIRRGDVQGASFAFTVDHEEWRKEGDLEVREVKSVRLYDVGPVTFPAYDATDVQAASQGGGGAAARDSWKAWKAAKAAADAAGRRRVIRLFEMERDLA